MFLGMILSVATKTLAALPYYQVLVESTELPHQKSPRSRPSLSIFINFLDFSMTIGASDA
jgi:hypothetical protein